MWRTRCTAPRTASLPCRHILSAPGIIFLLFVLVRVNIHRFWICCFGFLFFVDWIRCWCVGYRAQPLNATRLLSYAKNANASAFEIINVEWRLTAACILCWHFELRRREPAVWNDAAASFHLWAVALSEVVALTVSKFELTRWKWTSLGRLNDEKDENILHSSRKKKWRQKYLLINQTLHFIHRVWES